MYSMWQQEHSQNMNSQRYTVKLTGDIQKWMSPILKYSLAPSRHFGYTDSEKADAVYIVNIGGYIGESVRKELRYAQIHQ